jgi:hypothetical protein
MAKMPDEITVKLNATPFEILSKHFALYAAVIEAAKAYRHEKCVTAASDFTPAEADLLAEVAALLAAEKGE